MERKRGPTCGQHYSLKWGSMAVVAMSDDGHKTVGEAVMVRRRGGSGRWCGGCGGREQRVQWTKAQH